MSPPIAEETEGILPLALAAAPVAVLSMVATSDEEKMKWYLVPVGEEVKYLCREC